MKKPASSGHQLFIQQRGNILWKPNKRYSHTSVSRLHLTLDDRVRRERVRRDTSQEESQTRSNTLVMGTDVEVVLRVELNAVFSQLLKCST